MFNPVNNNPVHDVWDQQELPEYDLVDVEVPLRTQLLIGQSRVKTRITELNKELRGLRKLKASFETDLKELCPE